MNKPRTVNVWCEEAGMVIPVSGVPGQVVEAWSEGIKDHIHPDNYGKPREWWTLSERILAFLGMLVLAPFNVLRDIMIGEWYWFWVYVKSIAIVVDSCGELHFRYIIKRSEIQHVKLIEYRLYITGPWFVVDVDPPIPPPPPPPPERDRNLPPVIGARWREISGVAYRGTGVFSCRRAVATYFGPPKEDVERIVSGLQSYRTRNLRWGPESQKWIYAPNYGSLTMRGCDGKIYEFTRGSKVRYWQCPYSYEIQEFYLL
jgi:hypothetical protein